VIVEVDDVLGILFATQETLLECYEVIDVVVRLLIIAIVGARGRDNA
jgi:hypothetical protein